TAGHRARPKPLFRHGECIMKKATMVLLAGLLLPGAALALDAETRALEQAALCQAMPYRVEFGGRPPAPPTASPLPPATTPRPQQRSLAQTPLLTPAESRCQAYGDFIVSRALDRNQGWPYLQVLSAVRQWDRDNGVALETQRLHDLLTARVYEYWD